MMASSNPKFYKVRRPDTGQIGEVADYDLDQAISMGGEVVNDPVQSSNEIPSPVVENVSQSTSLESNSTQPSSEKMYKVRRPDTGQIGEVSESNLKEAQRLGGEIIEDDYNSIGKFGARSGKTIVSEAIGSLPDLATSPYNIPAILENSKTPEMKENSQSYFAPESPYPEVPAYPQAQLPIIPSVSENIESVIDDSTGGYTKTQDGDSVQAALKLGTAVATPGGLSKVASQSGAKSASKVLGSLGTVNPIGLAGAATTGATTSEASKAGYGVLPSMALGLGAGAGVGGLSSALKNLNVKLSLAKLTGNNPKNLDLKAISAADSVGLEIPNTVANESKGLANVEQVVSKAPYFGTKYAKKLNVSDENYANKVRDIIKNIGESLVDSDSPLDIGHMIKDTFSGVKDSVNNEKNHLYQEAMSLLPDGVSVSPNNVMKAIDSIKSNTKTLRPSTDESFVLNYLNDLEKGISLGTGKDKILAPVPVDMLIGSKVSINDIINWDINAGGSKKQLKRIQHAIKEDLAEYGKENPSWFKKFIEADDFYGKYLGDEALGSDTLKKKIFAQEDPEKILSSLNKISDFKALEQSLGRDQAGQKFYDSIKKEKLTDLISGKLINPRNDTVSYSGFSGAMENRQNKELIKYLSGENYQQLNNLNTYAKAAMRQKLRNPNPSGTAPTKLIYTMITGGVSGALAKGAVGAATGLIAPLGAAAVLGSTLSWLVTNKRALKWGIEAAKKEASGDFKSVATISNRLTRYMEKDLGEDLTKQFIALSKEQQKEKNNN